MLGNLSYKKLDQTHPELAEYAFRFHHHFSTIRLLSRWMYGISLNPDYAEVTLFCEWTQQRGTIFPSTVPHLLIKNL